MSPPSPQSPPLEPPAPRGATLLTSTVEEGQAGVRDRHTGDQAKVLQGDGVSASSTGILSFPCCVLEPHPLSADTALAPRVSPGPRWPSPDPLGFLTRLQVSTPAPTTTPCTATSWSSGSTWDWPGCRCLSTGRSACSWRCTRPLRSGAGGERSPSRAPRTPGRPCR